MIQEILGVSRFILESMNLQLLLLDNANLQDKIRVSRTAPRARGCHHGSRRLRPELPHPTRDTRVCPSSGRHTKHHVYRSMARTTSRPHHAWHVTSPHHVGTQGLQVTHLQEKLANVFPLVTLKLNDLSVFRVFDHSTITSKFLEKHGKA